MTKNCVCEKQNCIKCRLQKYKIEVENQGMKLLTTLGTFQTSKKLYVVCVCGTEKYSSLNDIKRGKKCMKCKTRKYKETCIKKYGCENVFQNEEIKEKIRKTNREKLGVDYPQQNKEIKTKTNETCKKKYGYAYAFNKPEIYEKIRKTHIKNHGVPFPLQNKDIRKKGEETCIKNHGVPKYLLTYKSKDFVLPSGKTIKVQGYEDLTLKTLLTEKHKILKRSIEEDEIYTGNTIQSFPYVDRKGKFRRYYPDIFISSIYRFFKEINENLIIGELKKYECFIEVKSVYTFNFEPETNYEKWKAVAEAGHNLKVYIYDNKKLLDIWTFFKNMEKPPRSMNKKIITFDEPIKLQKGELSQEDREYIAIEELFRTF